MSHAARSGLPPPRSQRRRTSVETSRRRASSAVEIGTAARIQRNVSLQTGPRRATSAATARRKAASASSPMLTCSQQVQRQAGSVDAKVTSPSARA